MSLNLSDDKDQDFIAKLTADLAQKIFTQYPVGADSGAALTAAAILIGNGLRNDYSR